MDVGELAILFGSPKYFAVTVRPPALVKEVVQTAVSPFSVTLMVCTPFTLNTTAPVTAPPNLPETVAV